MMVASGVRSSWDTVARRSVFILFNSSIHAQENKDIPIRINRISDRIIALKVADNPGGTNIIALNSKKGIVVVDTKMSYEIAMKARKTIEDEFKRKNFVYCYVH